MGVIGGKLVGVIASIGNLNDHFLKFLDVLTLKLSIIIIVIIIIIIIIELTHSKTILEITVEIKPQPAALDFKNLSQYSSCSK